MIGVSLPLSFLTQEGEEKEEILAYLKDRGVTCIELRTVRRDCDPKQVLETAQDLWARGFSITVHGEVKSMESACRDLFGPLALLLTHTKKRINVTLHPIVGDNGALLSLLADEVEEQGYPVTLSLENNRLLPDKTQGNSLALVYEAVKAADRNFVGICFDLGHWLYYWKQNAPEESVIPAKEILSLVNHTHIHALNGRKTHFPLGSYELPLRELLEALTFSYYGVYNLELDFPRLEGWTKLGALKDSVPVLQEALFPTARLYDRIRRDFSDSFTRALQVKHASSDAWSLIHSTSYLFHTQGLFWGMDLAFRACWELCDSLEIKEALSDLRLMVITHGHRDHLEERVVRALADNDTRWLVPHFLKEKLLSFGLPEEKMILAEEGVPFLFGPLTFLPFAGRHYRPVSGRGVRCMGYTVRIRNGRTLTFPADVRDWSDPAFPERGDLCFAHVWLGDDNRSPDLRDNIAPFARYMLAASERKIVLTHLYENGRPDHAMWRREHAETIKKEILTLSPSTEVQIPDWGETVLLEP